MRYVITLIALVIVIPILGLVVYRELTAGPPVVLPAPAKLSESTPRGQVPPGGWTNSPLITLTASGSRHDGLDVEVRPRGQSLKDTPTVTSKADPSATVRLPDGQYHWQARLHSSAGVSPWVV